MGQAEAGARHEPPYSFEEPCEEGSAASRSNQPEGAPASPDEPPRRPDRQSAEERRRDALRYAFFEGKIVPIDQARISVMTHGFLYGTGCFEGIRGYWVPEEESILLFRMREHYERLLNSCRIMQMKPAYGVDELCEITSEIVRLNGDREDVYVRPMFYKSSREIGVRLHDVEDDFTVFAVPFGPYLDLEKGLRVMVTSWRHIEDNMIPMRGKITGAYVNAALAKSEALENGYDEAIFLTHDGHVSEGSAENLFIVRDGRLITPPVTDDILEGITRDCVIELAREEMGMEVVERSIDRTELYVAEEAFFTGTGAQISPITEIDRRPVGDGRIGPISRKVQELYFEVVRGRMQKYRHWCTQVEMGASNGAAAQASAEIAAGSASSSALESQRRIGSDAPQT